MRPVSSQDAEAARRLRENGLSIRAIAKALRMSTSTIQKALKLRPVFSTGLGFPSIITDELLSDTMIRRSIFDDSKNSEK